MRSKKNIYQGGSNLLENKIDVIYEWVVEQKKKQNEVNAAAKIKAKEANEQAKREANKQAKREANLEAYYEKYPQHNQFSGNYDGGV